MDSHDVQHLIVHVATSLQRTARKTEEAGNYACVIGAVAQMNGMLSLVRTPVASAVTRPTPTDADCLNSSYGAKLVL